MELIKNWYLYDLLNLHAKVSNLAIQNIFLKFNKYKFFKKYK